MNITYSQSQIMVISLDSKEITQEISILVPESKIPLNIMTSYEELIITKTLIPSTGYFSWIKPRKRIIEKEFIEHKGFIWYFTVTKNLLSFEAFDFPETKKNVKIYITLIDAK